MQRGELWTLQDESYASKARPVVIIQGDLGDAFDSVILCLLTTFDFSSISTRVSIKPEPANGLKKQSFVMTEKIITVARAELGCRIGSLTDTQMHEINRQIAKLLAITQEDIE